MTDWIKSRRATEEIHDLYNSVLTKDLKNLHRGIFSIMNTGALLFNQPQERRCVNKDYRRLVTLFLRISMLLHSL
jgi:hypothetical protein